MKRTLAKKDKVLIGITILLYILGFVLGGWGIFPNVLFLFFAYSLFRKSHAKGKFSTFHLVVLMIVISLSILIKIGFFLDYFQNYSIKKNYEKQLQVTNTAIQTSFSIPELNLAFELSPKLSKCGTFTIDFEDAPYANRTISGNFPALTCPYDLYLNAYSINDRSEMGSLDIFMNIQGYAKRNNDYFYIRYYDDQTKETLIPKEAQPEEIQSDNGIKMLRVKGTGNIIIQETEKQWIGGLLSTDQGVIINTGNDIFPALIIASDLKKTGLSEEEFTNILKSFKKN